MNNYNSKKRKNSFANDRLKKLRTNINNDTASLSSSNTSKTVFTPSVKNSTPKNPNGYQERKKLIPVRKLNINEKKLVAVNKPEHNNIRSNIDESELFDITCKRRKIEVTEKKIVNNISTPVMGNISRVQFSNKFHNTPIQLKHNSEPQTYSPLKNSKKAVEQITRNPTISHHEGTPRRNSESLRNTNKNSVNSRLSKLKSNISTNFSDVSSDKTKFEYQHSPSVRTPQKNTNSDTKNHPCSSANSNNCYEHIGQALSSLYTKLFGSPQDADKNKSEEVANSDSMDWEPDDDSSSNENQKQKSEQEMFIIVDTNIFLDSLGFLQGIINYGSQRGIKPVIYVPWMVFNELDYIKDNKLSGLKSAASRAIDFINKMLTMKDGKLIGQSIFEANKQMYVGKSPDDKITSCCLQVKEKGCNAVLLSNDKNLRNKLIINGIPSLSSNDFLKNLDDVVPNCDEIKTEDVSPHDDKIKTLLHVMRSCCENIIADCCEEEYGSIWNKLALLDNNRPWDLQMCLKMFQKYWSAVFREKLLKQFLNIVEKMIPVMKNADSLKNPTTFENFAKDCLSLCFFLMDLEQFKDLIEETKKKINSLVGQKI